MNGEDEFGHINFGSRLVLQTDGTLEETQIESSASSPFQLHKPLPLSSFDREPVKLSLDHPLACSTPHGPCSDKARCQLPHKSTWADRLADNLNRTVQLTRDTVEESRSVLYQSNSSLAYMTRTTAGQMQYIQDALEGIEQRMENEQRMDEAYWQDRASDLDGALHPSGHVHKLQGKVHELACHAVGHVNAAANLRRGYVACEAAEKALDQSDKYYTQACEIQVTPGADYLLSENIQAAAKLNSVLYQVSETLNALKLLAPKAFCVNEERNTLGNYLEKTLCRIRALEWAISRHFPPAPPGQTPVPSQSTCSNISNISSSFSDGGRGGSSASGSSIFTGTCQTAMVPSSSLSGMSLSSTQRATTPWNLAVSPVTAKSSQSISYLLLNSTMSSGSEADHVKTAREAPQEQQQQPPTKIKRKSGSGTATPVLLSPRKMI